TKLKAGGIPERFGGATSNYSGTIENAELVYPGAVPGLAAFFLNLTERSPRQHPAAGGQHPARIWRRSRRGHAWLSHPDVGASPDPRVRPRPPRAFRTS